jgi:glucose/arabinose dehydrogenase
VPARTCRRAARLLGLFAAALLAGACGGAATPDGTGSSGLVAIGAGLSGPPGLRAATLATGLPNVAALALDPEGRLWATTAAYSPGAADGVYVIERPGAPPAKVLAGLRTPLGLLWQGDTMYVASTGQVDAYTGFDGTRFADHTTVVTWAPGVGESNEIVRAPDGRLLLGVSAPCDHCVPASRWSAAIVAFRPDGTGLEVYAARIRAPVGLVYFPGTSDVFVTMNQRDDLGGRTPGDWLSVVGQGEDWGFPDCYGQGGAACAGVPAPTATLDRHGAVGGVAIVTGQLGPAIGTSALVAEWAVGKVQRVALSRSGSGYRGSVHPFLAGLKDPLPVLATPAGAVLVGDWKTGAVYRVARA